MQSTELGDGCKGTTALKVLSRVRLLFRVNQVIPTKYPRDTDVIPA